MDGILLVNKPIGYTSRDVVNKIMKIFHTRKVGHTGTLDPFASGLLIITINKGTKIVFTLFNNKRVTLYSSNDITENDNIKYKEQIKQRYKFGLTDTNIFFVPSIL